MTDGLHGAAGAAGCESGAASVGDGATDCESGAADYGSGAAEAESGAATADGVSLET